MSSVGVLFCCKSTLHSSGYKSDCCVTIDTFICEVPPVKEATSMEDREEGGKKSHLVNDSPECLDCYRDEILMDCLQA